MRDKIVILADKFDREGKYELADAADNLLSTASRPKTPMKGLGDDTKKDLLKFIHQVKSNAAESKNSLNELAKRLRYFDVGNFMKELGLDKAAKDLDRVKSCADQAVRSMYAMSYGKNPSNSDMEQLADDFSKLEREEPNPLDFFESQYGPEQSFDERKRDLDEEDMDDVSEDDLALMYEGEGPTKEDSDINEIEWNAVFEDDPEDGPEEDVEFDETDMRTLWSQDE